MQGLNAAVSQSVSAAVGSGNMPAAGWLYASGVIGLMLVVLGAGGTELDGPAFG